MMKFAQNALLAAAVTLTPIAAATQAEAGDRYYRHHRGDDALALGRGLHREVQAADANRKTGSNKSVLPLRGARGKVLSMTSA
mgnify:CR=1 FL=1